MSQLSVLAKVMMGYQWCIQWLNVEGQQNP